MHTLPDCFGVLEAVFPEGPSGLREVPERCWECEHRVGCLREALKRSREGSTAGRVGRFLRRWSRLKLEAREGK